MSPDGRKAPGGYHLFDHTADLGIASHGPTPGVALAYAALGLTEVLAGRADLRAAARPDQEVAFEVAAPDREALAVAFLAEVLWLSTSRDLLWLGGGVEAWQGVAGWVAKATGNAVRHDPALHGRGVEVKAVTYHDVRFAPAADGQGWELRVLLDI